MGSEGRFGRISHSILELDQIVVASYSACDSTPFLITSY